jgi:hypothetical protein
VNAQNNACASGEDVFVEMARVLQDWAARLGEEGTPMDFENPEDRKAV